MRTIFMGVHGSTLYGTNTPESDMDYKGIFIPSPKSIIFGRPDKSYSYTTGGLHSKNTNEDVDIDMYSLKDFINMCIEGETIAIDMIHSNESNILTTSPAWEFIQRNRSKFYTTNMKAYMGYVRKQAAKYGVKGSRLAALRQVVDVLKTIPDQHGESIFCADGTLARGFKMVNTRLGKVRDQMPLNEFCEFIEQTDASAGTQTFYCVLGRKFGMTVSIAEVKKSIYKLWDEYGARARQAEQNQGIDWKALSHALRGGYQLLEIYETGDLRYPLIKADEILAVKRGNCQFSYVQQQLEDVVSRVEIAAEQAKRNGMPNQVDRSFWDEFILDVHTDAVKHYLK